MNLTPEGKVSDRMLPKSLYQYTVDTWSEKNARYECNNMLFKNNLGKASNIFSRVTYKYEVTYTYSGKRSTHTVVECSYPSLL